MTLLRLAGFLAALALVPSSARAVVLVHSNDVLGDIEPCGCRNNPQGGMPRKAMLLRQVREKGGGGALPASFAKDPELVQVDAGDLLFPTDRIPPVLAKQSELQASYILKAMDLLGHDAVVPGEKDFAMGVDTFDRLRKGAKLKFLAANLKRKNGKRFLDSHLIIRKEGPDGKPVRVAIIGLVGKSLPWPKPLKATPAIAAAKAELKALKGKADYFIAVTHQGLDEDTKLAEAAPGFDVIVGGHSQSFLQKPIVIGKTEIVQSSYRNQLIGLVPLTHPLVPEAYQLVALDAGFEAPSDHPMAKLVAEMKAKIAEVNSAEDQAEENRAVTHAAAPKYQTFPRCAECHLKQFDFWRKTPHADALHALVDKQQIRNKECLSCHTVGMGSPDGWSDVTKIAEVQKPLVKKDPSTNPEVDSIQEAIPADVSTNLPIEDLEKYLHEMHRASKLSDKVRVSPAFDPQPLHQTLPALTRVWAPVQCENCHQPGQSHPFAGAYTKTVEKTTCLNCHTKDRAPDWYAKSGEPNWELIAKKRTLIACPAGETQAEDLE